MSVVFKKTSGLTDKETHYCPGCTHGIIHRLVGEVLEELNIQGDTIGVAPVGCAVLAYKYFNCDMQQAGHGRAPAVATGIKRALPDKVVFTYQGDGDLASIGTAEIIHAAARGEKFTTIFVNNAIYGMTGGQMAPTTLPGQKATTCQSGRDIAVNGSPIRMAEILATLDGAGFVERTSVHNPVSIRKTKAVIKKAFENQINGTGFSIVEILSTCPTNWGISAVDSLKWLETSMIPYYPLGNKKEAK
ncbi:MAG: thiamine pyrophosphate-dependent enzyme [Fusobacteriaceae bacterium]